MDKKNVPVVIGLAVPLLMILLIITAIYLPRIFAAAPMYDFVYSIGDQRKYSISLDNGRLTVKDTSSLGSHVEQLRLFIYDVKSGDTREISVKEASELVLDASLKSPDGYTLEQDTLSRDMISGIFGYHDRYRWYLTGHGTSRKIEVPNHLYRWSFRFIGWVIQHNHGQEHSD